MRKPQGMVLATAGVLVATTVIDIKAKGQTGKVKNTTISGAPDQEYLIRRLLVIALLTVVLSFTVEQAPEFGGPLALLILVAALVRDAPTISAYFNQVQGNKK